MDESRSGSSMRCSADHDDFLKSIGSIETRRNSSFRAPVSWTRLCLLLGLALLLGASCASAADAASSNKTKLLILAQGRSGSSFLSSWFNVHPDSFYFLEPCGVVYQKYGNRDLTGTRCASLLSRVLDCDLSRVAVDRDQSSRIPEDAKGFKGWGHQRPVQFCNTSKLIAVKELRVGRAWLAARDAKESPFPADLRVVVLLRDPRAVMRSRMDWPKAAANDTPSDTSANPVGWNGVAGFPYDQSLRSMCSEHLELRRHLEALRSKAAETSSSSSNSQPLLVEYADVLKDPESLARRVFEFVGLDFDPHVKDFIQKNVRGDCEFAGEPFSVCRSLSSKRRDDKWRNELPAKALNKLLAIEECRVLAEMYDAREEKQRRDEM